MNDNERRPERNDLGLRPEVLTRVKKRISFRTSDESGEEVINFAMLTLSIVALSIGSWAMICLSKAIIDKGPLSIIKMLSEALLGK